MTSKDTGNYADDFESDSDYSDDFEEDEQEPELDAEYDYPDDFEEYDEKDEQVWDDKVTENDVLSLLAFEAFVYLKFVFLF